MLTARAASLKWPRPQGVPAADPERLTDLSPDSIGRNDLYVGFVVGIDVFPHDVHWRRRWRRGRRRLDEARHRLQRHEVGDRSGRRRRHWRRFDL